MLVLSLMLRNPSFATWHRCWWRWKSPQQQQRRRRQWRRRQRQLSQVPCLLQVWPACTMPASWPALLACLLQYLYFHDSNEVVIHFSVKLMMLQNLLDLLTLKRWFNQYWLKIIDYVFFFNQITHSTFLLEEETTVILKKSTTTTTYIHFSWASILTIFLATSSSCTHFCI